MQAGGEIFLCSIVIKVPLTNIFILSNMVNIGIYIKFRGEFMLKAQKGFSFVATGALLFSMATGSAGGALAENPPDGTRLEFESSTVLDTDGVTVLPDEQAYADDPFASGGKVVGQTAGRSFIFENVPEANHIAIEYCSDYHSSTVDVYVKEAGGSYRLITGIDYPHSSGWSMEQGQTAKSDEEFYIPENATVKFIPRADINMDYVDFSYTPFSTEEELDSSVLPAKNAALNGCKAEQDNMSILGSAAHLTKAGQSVSFTVPEGMEGKNFYALRYRATAGAKVTLSVNGISKRDLSLSATDAHLYQTTGGSAAGLVSGSTLLFTLQEDADLWIDTLALREESVTGGVIVDSLPTGSERLSVCLDGVWDCTHTSFVYGDAIPVQPPVTYGNTIPVPGLWNSAAEDMGSHENQALWYHTTVDLAEAPTGSATLKINMANYGRYIYVNGQFVEEYPYNYTSSSTDISAYLREGVNDIAIMVGNAQYQKDDPNCPAHTGHDPERDNYYPGITDSVYVIFNADPQVSALQTAADLENGRVQVRTTLQNRSASDVVTDVTYRIYERGVYENGEPVMDKRLAGTLTISGIQVKAGEEITLPVSEIPLDGFDESKQWTPDNPYLYEIEAVTAGDTYTSRFGMRTFYYDPETKLPMLNGEVYYLRGTNVAMHRFYEDPQREQHPWEENWARALYREFKDVGWDVLRFHIGFAPSLWYDVADEEGFLIMDEFAWFGGCDDGCTSETLIPETLQWMDDRCNHPSVIQWDMQNEDKNGTATAPTIRAVRDHDLQNRPWDNGWAPTQAETDTQECHPYLFIDNNFTLSDLNITSNNQMRSSNKERWYGDFPRIVNEYDWLWVDRNGDPTSLTKSYYDRWMTGSTAEERQEFYAKAVSQLTEFWRVGRAYVCIMHFTGLTYSIPNGQGETSDVLMPDLSTPKIHPIYKEAFRNAFAPLGIIIEEYTETVEAGQTLAIPVTLLNDLNEDIDDLAVTVTLSQGNTVLSQQTASYSVKKAGTADDADRQTQTFTVEMPKDAAGEYVLTASYTRDEETVTSTREWTVVQDDRDEISKGKPATASLEETDYLASYVTDGDLGTRWSSYVEGKSAEELDGASITIDLGHTYDIHQVSLNWELAFGKEYRIQVSDDNVNFNTIYTGTANGAGEQQFPVSGTGRYIRMQGVQRGSAYGYSLYEFRVWGQAIWDTASLEAAIAEAEQAEQDGLVEQAGAAAAEQFAGALTKARNLLAIAREDANATSQEELESAANALAAATKALAESPAPSDTDPTDADPTELSDNPTDPGSPSDPTKPDTTNPTASSPTSAGGSFPSTGEAIPAALLLAAIAGGSVCLMLRRKQQQ